MFQIGKLSVSSLTSTLGTAAIAANAVAGNIASFLNVPASAVGIGALTVVGQCLGAGGKGAGQALFPPAAPDRLRRGLGDESFRPVLPEQAGALLVQPLAGCLRHGTGADGLVQRCIADPVASSFTLPNILRAAGDAAFTMTVSVISMWVFRVAFCYLMVLKFHCGLLFIWMGMFLDWAMRSLFFCVRFVRGKWMEQKVI